MSKRKHHLVRKCAVDGCKETCIYEYDTHKEYVEAESRYLNKSWLCTKHSRTQLSVSKRYHEHTVVHKVTPNWYASGYKPSWKTEGKGFTSDNLFGDTWIAEVGELPLGTILTVTTTVTLSIPANPDPMPEWKPFEWFIPFHMARTAQKHPPVLIYDFNSHLTDGDFMIMVKNGEMLVGKHVYEDKVSSRNVNRQAYRQPLQSECDAISKALPHFNKGQRVKVKRYECDGYHCYDFKLTEHSATVLENEWCTAKVITTNGDTITVYRGYIAPDEPIQLVEAS